jgi:branched-chain amino acid transport system permease protein
MIAGNMVGHWNVDFFLVLLAAAAAGALISLLVGLPALRIKGLFLAVTTLAFAEALDAYFLNQNNFPSWIPNGVDRPVLWHRFDLTDNYTMYFVCLVFLGLSILAARGVRRARGGRVLIATRDNERAADAASVPTTSTKLGGFLLAGVVAGIAGALDVLLLSALSPGSFPATDSIQVFCTAVIGGLGSILGAISGVLLFQYLNSVTALGDLRLLLTGAGLLFVLLVFPGGIGQLIYRARDAVLRRIADRHKIIVPSLFADRADDTAASKDADLTLLSTALSGPPTNGDGGTGAPLGEPAFDDDAREKVGADR